MSVSLKLPPIPRVVLERVVRMALEEDIGRGDLTTEAVVASDAKGHAIFHAREALVLSGVPVVRAIFDAIDRDVELETHADEGARLESGARALSVRGPSRAILLGERVALNLMQRMSGIATSTRKHVDRLPEGSTCRIADTRKTTPGLRALERYAVRCGGGHNHRNDLSSAVMIKDNHIAAAGGVTPAIAQARAYAPHTTRIECEVDTMAQLEEALDAGADIIMLDNFDDDAVRAGVALAKERATRPTIIEASGGITLERITVLGAMVDVISIGALTHSARNVDIGLDWQ